jgi:small subunit ribosomal protein S6
VDVRKYEIMLILPSEADDQAVSAVVERIKGVIGGSGGEVSKVDSWGRRRLAFEIDKRTEGFYVVAEMSADPASIRELDRVLSLADDVVRFKVLVRAA